MAKTNTGLVEFCKTALANGAGYVYGAYGQKCTKALLDQYASMYPGSNEAGGPMRTKGEKWIGKRVMDCSGLIKYYLYVNKYGDDPSYNSAIDTCVNVNRTAVKEKGPMSTMPELPGVLVRMTGHVGVYIGNGEVIESQGTAYGVKKTKLAGRGWTQWFKLPEITYTSVSSNITLDTSSYVFNKVGQLYTFLAKCSQKPTVSSSNPSAVSVTYRGSDSRGYLFDIKPLAEGLSYISATLNGKTVGFRASLGCKIDTSSYTFNTIGQKYTFLVRTAQQPGITLSHPDVLNVEYTSEDNRGFLYTLTARKSGTCTVGAYLGNYSSSFPATVK